MSNELDITILTEDEIIHRRVYDNPLGIIPISEKEHNRISYEEGGLYVPPHDDIDISNTRGDGETTVMSQASITIELEEIESTLDTKVDNIPNHSLVSISDADKLRTVNVGATRNSSDEELRNRSSHTGTQPITSVDGLRGELDQKVVKEVGKGLVDLSIIDSLESLNPSATENRPDSELLDRSNHTGSQGIGSVLGLRGELDGKVSRVVGKELVDNADITKLKTISGGATKNRPDVELLNRSNHAGEQPMSSVTGLVDGLAGKVVVDPNRDLVSKTEIQKLSTVQSGATKNRSDSELMSRTNHTGTQPVSSVQGLTEILDSKVGVELGGRLMTSEEALKLTGISTGATKNKSDSELLSRSGHTGTQEIETISGLSSALSSKVNIEAGRGLIKHSDISKLGGIELGATKNESDTHLLNRSNHTGTQLIDTVGGLSAALNSKVEKVVGKELISTTLIDRIGSVQQGATKNQKDAVLLDRTSHTGAQPISSVTGLTDALNERVVIDSGKGLTPLSEIDKLSTVARGATKNLSDVALINRNNHTGTQEIETISGLSTALGNKVNREVGKQLIPSILLGKLSDMEDGATKNSPDEKLLNREYHTGTQEISSIFDLENQLNARMLVDESKGLVEYELIDKLTHIEIGATKNRADSLNADISHQHTMDEIVGLEGELDDKADIKHKHVITNIDGLADILETKANVADILGIENELGNKVDVTLVDSLLTIIDQLTQRVIALEEGGYFPSDEDRLIDAITSLNILVNETMPTLLRPIQ